MKVNFLRFAMLLSIVISLSFISKNFSATDRPVVKVHSGLISGIRNPETGIDSYKGIPYAKAPLGVLRWKAPAPAEAWTGVRNCESFGASPYQNKPGPFSAWSQEFIIPVQPISEDCLYLNVWSATAKKKLKPVLVWIYGGGFGSGGANVPVYDGEAMAAQGIVFVSFNYRVGVFGFMAHPELSAESGKGASGNYGLMDQIAALQWVRDNIAAFGGDPKQVTIAGQSAGSMSVSCLMAAPSAKALFSKAIAESGAYVLNHTGIAELRNAEKQGVEIAAALHTNSIAELRALPADVLQKGVKGGFKPIVDGYILPEAVGNCFAAGRQNKVPLLTGWNANEVEDTQPVKTVAALREKLEKRYGAGSEVILQHYSTSDEAAVFAAQQQLATAERYGMQNFALANLQSGIKELPVYVYRFYRRVPGNGDYAKFGAFHTGEVPYAYHNLKVSDRPWKDQDYVLEQQMSAAWVNFVLSGNPNHKGMPDWPKYDKVAAQVMLFGDEIKSAALAEKEVLQVVVAAQAAKVP